MLSKLSLLLRLSSLRKPNLTITESSRVVARLCPIIQINDDDSAAFKSAIPELK
jgi:hypothetical protein